MDFLISTITICAYGAQSVFQTRLISEIVLFLCLIGFSVRRQFFGIALCICTLATLLIADLSAFKNLWPIPHVICSIAIATYLVCLRQTRWYGDRRIRLGTTLIAICLGALSVLFVVAWIYFLHITPAQIPFKIQASWSRPMVIAAIFIFAVFNSFSEEFIFRGLAFESMKSVAPVMANLGQAAGFALMHFQGFPFGIWGAILAGLFALIMGDLRQRSGSFVYPWIAHFSANIGMGLILYHMSEGGLV